MVGSTVVRPPGIGRSREGVEHGLGEVERERLRAAPAAETRTTPGPLGAVDADAREEPGHRAAVADEDLLAAAVQLEAQPPAERPGAPGRPSS